MLLPICAFFCFKSLLKMKILAGRCDFPGSPRLHMIDLDFLNQSTLHRLKNNELSKKIKQLLSAEPTSVSIKPFVSHAEAS